MMTWEEEQGKRMALTDMKDSMKDRWTRWNHLNEDSRAKTGDTFMVPVEWLPELSVLHSHSLTAGVGVDSTATSSTRKQRFDVDHAMFEG